MPIRALLLSTAFLSAAACQGEPQAVAEETASAETPAAAAYFTCAEEAGIPLLAAHRGGPSTGYPENALETLLNVDSQIPALLEIDIRRGPDGGLVLLHDETLERTTTGEGALIDAGDLSDIRLEDNEGDATRFKIPSLAEALEWADGEAMLELDVKDVPFAEVIEAVRAAGAEEEVVIITYDLETAREVHALAPELLISAPVYDAADLASIRRDGPPLQNLLAWTGTRSPDYAHWAALEEVGVPILYGALGDFSAAQIRDLAEKGADVIVTDHIYQAARTLYGEDMIPDNFTCEVPAD